MGIRGEIYSTKVALQNRTYFFNVKENRMGDLYLNIVESKNKETGGFDRQSIVLFADDLAVFLKSFDDSLRVMEKAVKEKRKTAPTSRKRDGREETAPATPWKEGKKAYPPKSPKTRNGKAKFEDHRDKEKGKKRTVKTHRLVDGNQKSW